MKIFLFRPDHPAEALDTLERMPADGFVWLDFTRDEPPEWGAWAERLLGVRVDIQHIEDSLNPAHVSFFDGVDDYDMLIFHSLRAGAHALPLDTEPAVFFIFENLLVTVHASDAVGFDFIGKRSDVAANARLPRSAVGLAYRIIDTMIDRFLATRDAIGRSCENVQDEMLRTPAHVDDQWLDVMRARRSARRLAALSEDQWETVEMWRRDSRFDWDDVMLVRLRDLTEHITRIRDLANALERDLESAMQLNFAILAQRQGEVMKIFTVVAAVFLPLMLLTGIWGMNFENMPELHWKYGYVAALSIIFGSGGAMLWWLRSKKFF